MRTRLIFADLVTYFRMTCLSAKYGKVGYVRSSSIELHITHAVKYCISIVVSVVFVLQEHDHSCTVHARLYTSGENAQTIAEFALDLVSPVEYLFRKFSANEFGKPPHPCVKIDM